MKRNKLVILLFAVLAISFSIPAFTVQTAPTSPEVDPETIDIGPKLRSIHNSMENLNPGLQPMRTATHSRAAGMKDAAVGDFKWWRSYDDLKTTESGTWWDPYELVAASDTTEVWLQVDTAYYLDYDYITYTGTVDTSRPVIITQEQIDAFLEEFDTHIYPTVTEFYGLPDDHNGSQSLLEAWGLVPTDYYDGDKFVILISNIRDTYFWDPDFPIVIAGFYWGLYEQWFDRNIINIDADFWETYLWPDEDDTGFVGTTAHELQHLIHADYNPDDATFMNEGCSTYAEYLCGYGVPWGDIEWYMATPDNSLIIWGDQGPYNSIADYGAVFLWAMYLQDHFGPLSWWPGFEGNFLGLFVQYGLPGVSGLDAWFNYLSGGVDTFDSVFHDWRIANLIDSDEINERYSYPSIDLTEVVPPRQYEVFPHTFMYGTEFGTTITTLGDDTGVSMLGMYGSDYIRFVNPHCYRRSKFFFFDGDDGVALWQEIEPGLWYSGAYNLGNALLYGSATIGPEATLTFETFYDIEQDWDFGFVQISTDGGETWTSLTNDYTVDVNETNPDTHPDIIAQEYGLTGVMFPTTMTFGLTGYEGDVLIGFRYMTDWYVMHEGWYVSNVAVDDTPIELVPALTPIEWQVTLVYYKKNRWTHELEVFRVRDVRLRDICDFLHVGFSMITHNAAEVVAIISPVGFDLGYVDYWFGIWGFKCGFWK